MFILFSLIEIDKGWDLLELHVVQLKGDDSGLPQRLSRTTENLRIISRMLQISRNIVQITIYFQIQHT